MSNSAGTDLSHPDFEEHEFLHHDVLPQMIRNMRFVSVFYLIYGAFVSITIIGAVFGVPIIIMGLRLRDMARGYRVYDQHNNQKALHFAFVKQRSFFYIQKLLIGIMIVFMVLYFVGIIFLVTTGSFEGLFGNDEYQTLHQLPAALLG